MACVDTMPGTIAETSTGVERVRYFPRQLLTADDMRLEQEYFRELVEPHLGGQIEYLGEVTHGEKVELLQNARATLFPIEWEEPFGLVMIESMACGTPVIATRWGAVPEVIEHGRSGIIVDDYRLMTAAIEDADRLEPLELVRYAQEHFSPERMVTDYLRAFHSVLDR